MAFKMARGVANLILAAGWILIGILGGMYIEGWSFITSTHVIVQIVTTIGYGDMSVDPWFRFFMTVYVLFGVVYISTVLMDISNKALDSSMEAIRGRIANAVEQAPLESHEKSTFFAASSILAFFVLFGVVFYAVFESCTCGYGTSVVVGCDPDKCATTGGVVKGWGDCIYMTVITLSTVGFGDFAPRSEAGRCVGCFWMLFGVIATANFVAATSKFIGWLRMDHTLDSTRDIFKSIDKDGNGKLARGEFMCWCLQRDGILSAEDADHFYEMFDEISGADKKISFAELCKYFHVGESPEDETDVPIKTPVGLGEALSVKKPVGLGVEMTPRGSTVE